MAQSYPEYLKNLLDELLRLAPVPDEVPRSGWAFSRPPKPELGDLALGAFPLAKLAKRSPKEAAEAWAEAVERERNRPGSGLAGLPIPLAGVQALGPYLNLTLDPVDFARFLLREVLERGAGYGRAGSPSGQKVMVEYSSPNTNKPLHLGHVRNNLIGMSLSNILEAAGDEVIRVNLVNDRGIHICKSMLAYQRWGEGKTPAETGEKGDHFVGRFYTLFAQRLAEERRAFAAEKGVDLARFDREHRKNVTERDELRGLEEEAASFEAAFNERSELMREARRLLVAWEAGDPEVRALWGKMNDWVYAGFRETYERMGSRFDRWYHESETYQLGKQEVERGLEKGVFYRQQDGSVWARLQPLGLQDKLLLRSDGTSVYMTQDLGTAIRKHEDYGMDRSIYVVGSEQEAHFRNLFAILKLLDQPWADGCYHASYALVTLPRGMGRLKSREGTAVDADDLLDELHRIAREKIEAGGYCDSAEAAEETAEQIGQGALKLYLLQVGSDKAIQFDPEQTISFTGDTGPAVQYSHARIQGILRKAIERRLVTEAELASDRLTPPGIVRPRVMDQDDAGNVQPRVNGQIDQVDPGLLREREEQDVLRQLAEYPQAMALAARQMSAAPVANYLLDLTKLYARMYHEHEVLRADSPELLRARLQLALGVAQVLRNGLGVLTIEAPDRM